MTDKLGEFASIHLRNGPDWKNACSLINNHNLTTLFASPQCNIQVIHFLKKIDKNKDSHIFAYTVYSIHNLRASFLERRKIFY